MFRAYELRGLGFRVPDIEILAAHPTSQGSGAAWNTTAYHSHPLLETSRKRESCAQRWLGQTGQRQFL